eukprot:TRINITY_DN20461_c0_g1_i1.p1 TRINITY_DN20461_c0_g1~~TRINITY_DN20461_c0_g1_i1.p1  ORF type:complete len:194 (+),score=21.16 TRINITY_DN20461_c0_g1_i1:55-582(+)
MRRKKRYSQVNLADKPTNLLPSGNLNIRKQTANGPICAEPNQLLREEQLYSSFTPNKVFEPDRVLVPFKPLKLPIISPPKKPFQVEYTPYRLSPSNRKKMEKINNPAALLPSINTSRTVVFLKELPKTVKKSPPLQPLAPLNVNACTDTVGVEKQPPLDRPPMPNRTWYRRSILL